MKNTKEETLKEIHFKFNRLDYTLNITESSLCDHMEVDYDTYCANEGDGYAYEDANCSHDMGRCRRIHNISRSPFDWTSFLNNHLEKYPAQHDQDTDANFKVTVEIAAKALKEELWVEDYIEAEGQGDYYGESLVKSVRDVNAMIRKIAEILEQRFKDVSVS